MQQVAVSYHDGIHHIVRADGEHVPIRLGGVPVENFAPGWRVHAANGRFSPWVLLDLRHENGDEATWILAASFEHRANRLADLPLPAREAIVDTIIPVLRDFYDAALCRSTPIRKPVGLDLLAGINRAMITELVDLALRHAPMPTRVVDLFRCDPDPQGYAVALVHGGHDPASAPDGQPPETITLRAVGQCLSGNIQGAFADALSSGGIACPSPVDGRVLHSRDSLVLHEHRIAYRFVDDRCGLVFFVSTTHLHFAKADVFIPAANIAFKEHEDQAALLAGLAALFLAHALREAEGLLAYLGRPERRFASACRGVGSLHIGHHLWNELTGLDRLVRRVPPEKLPTIIVPDAEEGSEIYAPIDRIFPEFAGRIDRHLRWPRTMASFVYANSYCLMRIFDEHISLALADRIRRAVALEPTPPYDLALASRLASENVPCILIGVRVENRTAVDLESTLIDIISHLKHRLGEVAIVLDGQNARLGHDPISSFGSAGQHGGHEHPVLTELRLAQALQRRFAHSSVRIINLFGAAMARSLFWSQRSAFFIAFWGAGLAKYRWVCNRPGLVLCNRWNLLNRGDLEIYNAPQYQEGGGPIRFIDPDSVTDDASAALLFSPVDPVPLYCNFRVTRAPLLRDIDLMLAEHLPAASSERDVRRTARFAVVG